MVFGRMAPGRSVWVTLLCAALACCKSTAKDDAALPSAEPWLNPLAATESSVPIVSKPNDYRNAAETAQLPHYSLRLGEIKTCPIEPYLKPKPGSTVLGVEVTITGTTALDVPANPFYATLLSQTGEPFPATLAGCKPELRAAHLNGGKDASGFISFVVPEGGRAWKFHYRPAIIGAAEEEARFDLAR